MAGTGFRRIVGALLCSALAAPAGAAAAPATLSDSIPVADGAPTPEACAPLGFDLSRVRQVVGPSGVTYRSAGLAAPPAATLLPTPTPPAPPPPPPPPAPPPPPLPLPPVKAPVTQSRSVNEVVVSGSRRQAVGVPPGDTERYPDASPNPVKRTVDEPVSTFSIDVDTASYANVRRFLNAGEKPPADAVRVEELVNYFDYGYPQARERCGAFRPFVAVTPSPWNAGRRIVHIGLQGYAPPTAGEPPLNLVFLVDSSGSMFEPDRLPLAVQSLNVLIDRLRPQDKVALVTYAGAAGEILPPTSGAQKLKMRCALQTLTAGGSTAGGAGLQLAYTLAQANSRPGVVSRVILMTDGDFNVGMSDPSRLKDYIAEKRGSGVYLSVYGFGRGNYQDRTMQALSQAGNGTAGYIDGLSEARKLFRTDFSRQIFPIADDVKIQVEFNPAQVGEYRLIGYETRLLKREDFNNDKVDAGEVGAGANVTALYEISPPGGPSSVDPLRYGRERPAPRAGKGDEIAFLRIRWKPPHGQTSQLIERPIGRADAYASLAAAPNATRWAVAVAGYGQLLKRDPHVEAGFGWREVQAEAESSRQPDASGLKAEFADLTHVAERATGN